MIDNIAGRRAVTERVVWLGKGINYDKRDYRECVG
jgi:hypothetical protein